ncbi:MAG TPA: ferritin-like domain-containing protein [Bacteroidia bacterium]|nr:ferritin-like domain-containing protein [Bacteroidia bacterium]
MNKTLTLVKNEGDLPEALQQAVDIEMSTIPIYLYTYYSLIRVPNQTQIQSDYANRYINEGMDINEAAQKSLNRSVDFMVFANKAGATIMSVAVEEMLHMALASNLYRALVGMPKLVGRSPEGFPVNLPGRVPPLSIPLASFSSVQMQHFIDIESPSKPLLKAIPMDWTSIGDFYNAILKYIDEEVKDEDFKKDAPQLGPGNAYYAHNNVNTMYYNRYHKPVFTNGNPEWNQKVANDEPEKEDGPGDLVYIVDKKTARKAIKIIVDQGEGIDATHTMDDASKNEESHYRKFLDLKAELDAQFTAEDLKYFVKQFPDNPTTANYPADVQAVSNMVNAVYTYMYMLMDACYRNPLIQQKEIFNFGMHKGMIFVLSTLCDFITSIKLPNGLYAAPTFENYEFASTSTAKSQLLALYNQIPASLNPPSSIPGRLSNMPDVSSIPGQAVSL